MDKQTKTRIKNTVLALRDDFGKEIENRLNNIGIYPDKEWKDGRSLTHLSKEEIENRKRVAAFIKREEKIGLDQKKATLEFIKEASYTWINRLLGLKCMECRGLIEEVITTRPEVLAAYGDCLFLMVFVLGGIRRYAEPGIPGRGTFFPLPTDRCFIIESIK